MRNLLTLIGFVCCASGLFAQGFDWVTHIPGLSEEISRDIAVGPAGNAYVCGTFGNTMILPSGTISSAGFRDGFLFKIDPQGNLLWHVLMSGTFNEDPIAVEVDSLENIYVLMEVGDTVTIQGNVLTNFTLPYLVVRFDSSGQYLSHFEPIADYGQGAGFSFAGMSVSPGGRISLAGSIGVFVSNPQSITFGAQTFILPVNPINGFRIPQGWTAQFQPDGTFLWANLTNGGGTSFIYHLGAAPDGGVVVCGAFGPAGIGVNPDFDFGPGTPSLSTDFGEAGFVARFDSSSNLLWAQAMHPGQPVASQMTQARAQKLAVDPDGAVYLYGEYVETVRWGSDSVNAFPPPFFGTVMPYGFVAKASPAGVPMWIQGVSFGNMGNARVQAMTADTTNVFLGGTFSDTLLIGGMGLFGGIMDLWFASLDGSNGQSNFAETVPAPGFPDEVNGLAVQENGRLFVTGTFDPPATFGAFSVSQPPNSCCSNFFITSYGVGCTSPQANFLADSAGIYQISFVNQSTVSGTASYLWDFGDGNTASTTNPAHIYSGPGTYLVCLIASDSCGIDTFCQPVIVPCQPGDFASADFTLINDTSNLTITLVNTSLNATSVLWDFGDGTTSTVVDPTHQYNQPGSYSVCLIVTGTCNTDTLCQPVVADCDSTEIGFTFTSDTTNLTVSFTDQSINVEDYFWSFGDGDTDTVANPVHQYSSPGSYTVCLITFGICDVDTLCRQVVAECDSSEIGFSFASDTTNATVSFTSQSSNVESYLWSFGDGRTDTVANPKHQYFLPGTYTVCLITFGPCDIDTLCQTVVVDCDIPAIGFVVDDISSDGVVTIINTTVNAGQYLWLFGDGSIDTVANPVHQYEPGTYNLCLVAFGPCNIDTMCQVITVEATRLEEVPESGFRVYPNPTQGEFTLELQAPLSGLYLLELYDTQGRRLWIRELPVGTSGTYPISLQEEAAGHYLLRIRGEASQQIWRVRKIE